MEEDMCQRLINYRGYSSISVIDCKPNQLAQLDQTKPMQAQVKLN
jgi:hypothetical protein